MPRTDVDLARVGITDHARDRWAERIGLPRWQFRFALNRARRPNRRLRRRIRQRLTPNDVWRDGCTVRIDRQAGAVFVLRPQDDAARKWCVATVIALAEFRLGGGIVDAAVVYGEGFACPTSP